MFSQLWALRKDVHLGYHREGRERCKHSLFASRWVWMIGFRNEPGLSTATFQLKGALSANSSRASKSERTLEMDLKGNDGDYL